MSWLTLGLTVLLIWLQSKEKPLYNKSYHETRADGAFWTSYDAKFGNYLQHIKDEVKARITLGLISPLDDLYVTLYHPELPEHWQRSLYPNQLAHKAKQVVSSIFWIIVVLLVADGVTRILTGGCGLLYGIGTDRYMFRKILAVGFAASVCYWLNRRRHSESQTQGYIDGYSDCSLQALQETLGIAET